MRKFNCLTTVQVDIFLPIFFRDWDPLAILFQGTLPRLAEAILADNEVQTEHVFKVVILVFEHLLHGPGHRRQQLGEIIDGGGELYRSQVAIAVPLHGEQLLVQDQREWQVYDGEVVYGQSTKYT